MTEQLKQAAQQALACMRGLQQHLGPDICAIEADALERAITTSQPAQAGEQWTETAAALNYYAHNGNWPTQPAAQATPEPCPTCDSLRKDFARECVDTDTLLRLLGFVPEEVRTDGGSLNLMRLASLIEARKATPEPRLFIGACITDGRLHATVQRLESNGHVTLVAMAEMDAASLHGRDCVAQMTPATPEPVGGHDMAVMSERGAKAWAGVDPQDLRAGPTPEPVLPFLVRDVAALLGASVPDVCKALAHLGHGQRSTNMEIKPEEALAVAEHIRAAAVTPEPVGAREALERIASWNEHPAMLGVDYGSNGVRDYYRKIARDALAAAQANGGVQ